MKHDFLQGTNKDDCCFCWFLQPLSVYMVDQKEKIDDNHTWDLRRLRRSYALPTGFHADIIIRRSSGLFLILSITVANWSTPWPLYSACMLMYLAPKWRHWNPYTGPRSPSSRSCKPNRSYIEMLIMNNRGGVGVLPYYTSYYNWQVRHI